jgi:uncharacterized membrane protein (UPF0127 family)
MPLVVRPLVPLLLLGLLTGCGGDGTAAPSQAQPAPPSSSPETVTAVLDGVELTLEVADEPAERAVGLMRRESVPPGTGMVFLYDEPSTGRYYMFDVPVPLRAVFIADGRVVSTVVMPPCEEPEPGDCPTYGSDQPYDTVVETAPDTLPDVQPGDEFHLDP